MLLDTVTVVLTRGEDGRFGIKVNYTTIVKIFEGSQAETDGLIHVGDEILAINHKNVDKNNIRHTLQNSGPSVNLTIRRAGNI